MSTDGGITTFKGEEDHSAEMEELGLRFQYGCYMDKLPESCHSLGLWYKLYKENQVKAMDIYSKNCEAYRHPESCINYAIGLFYGFGGKEDKLSSFEILKKNCNENNHNRSCYAAGEFMANGFGILQPDLKESVNFFKKSCKLNNPAACYNAGLINLTGKQNVEKNLKKSAKFLTKACNLGHPKACFNLALMYRNGDFFKKDESKFIELIKLHEELSGVSDVRENIL